METGRVEIPQPAGQIGKKRSKFSFLAVFCSKILAFFGHFLSKILIFSLFFKNLKTYYQCVIFMF